jgi:paraquat-inducible protein A
MNGTSADVAGTPVIACQECGTVHPMRALPEHGAATCARCGAMLYRSKPDTVRRTLVLTLAALIMFALAHAFPFMTFKLEGRADTSTLLSGVIGLYDEGFWPLAAVVLLTATLLPLAKLLSSLYVLLPILLDRRPPGIARVFRAAELVRPWAMMEVYLLGVLVAYVKLTDLARIELGIALYAFVALILLMVAAEATLDPHQVWQRLAPQARWRPGLARRGTLVSCHGCDQVCQTDRAALAALPICPRCGSALHARKPNSIARTWALVIAAAILYIPANLLPVMTVVYFGRGEPDTILSGVKALIEADMWPVALLVFFASITVPVLKLLGLTFLLVTVQRRSAWRTRDRALLYRVIEGIGRWSMVDIFMISILVALVNLGAIATIVPGAGAICFAAVVILTMFASMSFEPRLIWDAREKSDAGRPPLRA